MEGAIELVLIQRVVVVGRDGGAEACVGRGRDGTGSGKHFQRLLHHESLLKIAYRLRMPIMVSTLRHSDGPKEGAAGSGDEKRKYIWEFSVSAGHFFNG